jgi:YVTN family beta-propeller protein
LLAVAAIVACGGSEPEPPPVVATVTIEPSSLTLDAIGGTAQLTATARDGDGGVITGKTFTWSMQSGTAASVTPQGLVTALANGNSTVAASVDGVTGAAIVTVAQVAASVTVTPPAPILTAIDDEVQLEAVVRDANGHVVAGAQPAWSSPGQTVARVSASGLVTAVANGSVSVSASVGSASGSSEVVVDQVGTRLEFTVQPSHRKLGQAIRPAIEVAVRDANGHLVADGTDEVTLLAGNTADPLGGTITVRANAGVARFDDLRFVTPGLGYTLVAVSGSLTRDTSADFSIGSCPCAYVTNSGANTVTVIERSTNAIIGVIPVGSSPYGIALTPDGARAYVTNVVSHSVSVIDIASDTVLATIDTDLLQGHSGPSGIAITPDGQRAYVANRFAFPNGPVSVISIPGHTLDTITNVGLAPTGVAISPDGSIVYVTNNTSSTVSVFSTASNVQIDTVRFSMGTDAHEVVFAPNGSHAYVVTGDGAPHVVRRINAAGGHAVDVVLGVNATGLAVSPAGDFLYASGREALHKVELQTFSIVETLDALDPSPTARSALAITADGTRAYRTAGSFPGASSVTVVDLTTFTVIARILVGALPAGIALTP